MKPNVALLVAVVVRLLPPAALGGDVPADTSGSLAFVEPHASFAPLHQGETLTHSFAFKNEGRRAVKILSGIALTSSGAVAFEPAVVAPGAQGVVTVSQPIGAELGVTGFRFAVVTDEGRYRMNLSGFVESAFEPETPRLDFGTIDRERGSSLEIEVASREVPRLDTSDIEAPPFLEVKVGAAADGAGIRLRAGLLSGCPVGLNRGTIRVRTNVPTQPWLVVSYAYAAWGDVVPAEHPVSFGLVRMGEEARKEVELASRAGKSFEVAEATDPDGIVGVEITADGKGGLARLVATVHPRALGPLDGTLLVWLGGEAEPLPISYRAIVMAPETSVREIDMSQLPAALPVPPVVDRSVDASPAEPAPLNAEEGAPAVTLRWKARAEKNVYGYLVYRSDRREGPFIRISAIVPVAGGEPESVHAYTYRDENVAPGKTYYYYLDLLTVEGLKTRFSGVISRRVAARKP